MAWSIKSKYFSGQGVVLMGDTDDVTGEPVGLLPVGNVSALKISLAASTLEHQESQTGQRGIDLRLTTELKVTVSMELESYIADNIALGLRALVTKKVGATVAAELSKAYFGKIMPLKHAKVSSVVIKDLEATPNTLKAYTPGDDPGEWDYMVNAESGSIQWATTPKQAGFADGDGVTIAYTYATQDHVEPLTVPNPEKFLRFEGLNTSDTNKPTIIEIFRFAPDPFKELDLISNQVGKFPIESSALMDTRRTGVGESQYFRQILVQ